MDQELWDACDLDILTTVPGEESCSVYIYAKLADVYNSYSIRCGISN
jgi:hypothetical protein